jgi:hypothetical protein
MKTRLRMILVELQDGSKGSRMVFNPAVVRDDWLEPSEAVWFDLVSGRFAIPADDGEPILISRRTALEILESDLKADDRPPLVHRLECTPGMPPVPGAPLFGIATSGAWRPGGSHGANSPSAPTVRTLTEMDHLQSERSPLSFGQYVRSWMHVQGHAGLPSYANPAYTVWSHDLSLICRLCMDAGSAFSCATHVVCMDDLLDPDPEKWSPFVRNCFTDQQVLGQFVLFPSKPCVRTPVNGNCCWHTLACYSRGSFRSDGAILKEALS